MDNRLHAILVFVATVFLVLGTAGATLPNFIPSDAREIFATVFWIFGILGLALNEALYKSETATTPSGTATT